MLPSPSNETKKSPKITIFKRKSNFDSKNISIFNHNAGMQDHLQTKEIKRVFEEWEKNPHIQIEKS